MRSRTWIWLGLFAILALASPRAAGAEEAGFVQGVHGKVSRKSADGKVRVIQNFDSVEVNDIVVADRNSSVEIISFASGAHIKLGPSATCRVQDQNFKAVSGSLVNLKPIDKKFLRAVRGSSAGGLAGVTTRGGDEADLSPNQTIRTDSAKLNWPKIENPKFLSITITEGERVILAKDIPVNTSSFNIDDKIILRGHRYGWSVSSMDGDGLDVSYVAAFYVLSREEDESLKSLEAAERGDASLQGALMVAYQRLGLNQEARNLQIKMQP